MMYVSSKKKKKQTYRHIANILVDEAVFAFFCSVCDLIPIIQ